MSFWNLAGQEIESPFERQPIEKICGPEVSLFLQCHLRGYDETGEGEKGYYEYYDKYGAPVQEGNSWQEGYHAVEKKLAYHNNAVVDSELNFPFVAGMGGSVHIYKAIHKEKPWNWTGWIPRQKPWACQGNFLSNRYFLGLRGNEVQNNLWDYHPHEEDKAEPNDRYRGGYWYHTHPFGRYLHIISLKSHKNHPETNTCLRYNYIVHPLAYRPSVNTLPDNSVDAMQWAILNIHEEGHFGEGKPWGEKCHGIEIFNDFTYFNSYQPLEKGGPNNGDLCEDPKHKISGDSKYYFWYDTYPLEFAEFLLDSALARGVYLHTVSANDAFYERSLEEDEVPNKVLLADPKGRLVKYNMKLKSSQDPRLGVLRKEQPKNSPEEQRFTDKAIRFLNNRPYKIRTSFGYVTLLDPRHKIKEAVCKEEKGIKYMGLNDGEILALEYLTKGSYYSTTGLSKLFKYEYPLIPYRISRQPNNEELCYEITNEMELKFTFLKCSDEMAHLIWRYTILTKNNGLEASHGYFKLDPHNETVLDLNKYGQQLTSVKYIYFTAISPNNPQHRAWFHAIKGPAFGERPFIDAKIPTLKHNVVSTSRHNNVVTTKENIEVTEVESGELDFALEAACNEKDIYVYFMQTYPHQQDLSNRNNEKIKESSDFIPPQILQSVHGYFSCRDEHPTRINLSASWNSKKVKDCKVYFYRIDSSTGQPSAMKREYKPKLFPIRRTVMETVACCICCSST